MAGWERRAARFGHPSLSRDCPEVGGLSMWTNAAGGEEPGRERVHGRLMLYCVVQGCSAALEAVISVVGLYFLSTRGIRWPCKNFGVF